MQNNNAKKEKEILETMIRSIQHTIMYGLSEIKKLKDENCNEKEVEIHKQYNYEKRKFEDS